MSSAARQSKSSNDALTSVRLAYDVVAEPYAENFTDELRKKPLDRGIIEAFAYRVRLMGDGGRVADLGCGPGHTTQFLCEAGLPALGIDLSPRMIELATATYPAVEFRIGSLLDIDAPDSCWDGVMSLYSVIHLPPEQLRGAISEFSRVLRPGGWLLLAFHTGNEKRHVDEWFGQPVSLDTYFFETADVIAQLKEAGFAIEVKVERLPYPEIEVQTERAYLLARRLESGA